MIKFSHTSQAVVGMGDTGPVIRGLKDKNRKLPTALYFASIIEATGSSDPFARGIIKMNAETVDYLGRTMGTLQLGLHIARDLDYDHDADFSLGQNLTIEDFKANLLRIEFKGGGDELETQFDSVLTVARTYAMDMSPTARRVICLFSSSGSKPTRDGKNAAQVAQELKTLGIRVVVVAPHGENLHELADGTGGISLELTNDPTSEDIRRVTQLLTRTLTLMAERNTGGTMMISPNDLYGKNGTQMLGIPE